MWWAWWRRWALSCVVLALLWLLAAGTTPVRARLVRNPEGASRTPIEPVTWIEDLAAQLGEVNRQPLPRLKSVGVGVLDGSI